MKILELIDVGYKYEDTDKHVLKNINMEFATGKTYAIKGRSGSGKTTLLSLLSGLEKCNEGEIIFNNKPLSKMNLDEYRNKYIGIVFQSFNLLPHLTALENVILSMDVSGIEKVDKNAEALRLLESVGITKDIAIRRVLKLSGGEQQRVAIARSLSYNPKIILADEPTGNLDKETENDIMQIFKDLASKDKCIIIVTHSEGIAKSVDEVYEISKRK